MKYLFDLHTHTISSGHAFSTLKENIERAAEKGLIALGTSDHAMSMPGTAGLIFFMNNKAIREQVMGVKILRGIEANILNYEGEIDIPQELYPRLDYIIASLHSPCIKSGTSQENTAALIGAMKNPYVKMIGHPDDSRYPVDYEQLTDAARDYHIALELNNSSYSPASGRKNAHENDVAILNLCKKKGVSIILGSDAHIYYDVGNFEACEKVLKETNFPEELIINCNMERLKEVVNKE